MTSTLMQMLHDEGCRDASVVWLSNTEESLTIVRGAVDKLQRSETHAAAINLYIDGRQGFFYTNELDTDALRSFVRRAVQTTRLLVPDPMRSLAAPSRYYQGGGEDLRIFDPHLSVVPTHDKVSLSLSHNQEVIDVRHSSVINVETHYSDNIHHADYLISNGFEGHEASTYSTLATVVSVKGEGDARPMDGWGQTRLFYDQMPPHGIGTIALERAVKKIGQRTAPSGIYTMVVESPVTDKLLQPLLGAMGGSALQQHLSFLEGRMDTVVGSPLLHLVDDPHLPGTRGASYFDFDGVATQRRTLFEEGTLRTWFIDTANSRRLGIPPTTTGIHHCILTPGLRTLPELLADLPSAILVTDFNGGNCNPTTGDFSYGIEGFLYQQGRLVHPVSGMNITGNMLDLWQHLVAVSNDADPFERLLIPSLVFDGVAFS